MSQDLCLHVWNIQQSASNNSSLLFSLEETQMKDSNSQLESIHSDLLLNRTFYTVENANLYKQPTISVDTKAGKLDLNLWDLGERIISAVKILQDAQMEQFAQA